MSKPDPKRDYIPINKWDEESRPREKWLKRGIDALTNAELLAILMRSGTRRLSAVDLAKEILSTVDQRLLRLSRMSLTEIMQFKGIGEAKGMTILAALELGKRRRLEEGEELPSIKSSRDAYKILSPLLEDLSQEEFWFLLLNRKNSVIKRVKLSVGGISGTVVDKRLLFKQAIECLSSGIILAHNHPSGNLKPSRADLKITHDIQAAGKVLDIQLLDHLIITSSGYMSMADEGMLN